jgi:hypothetical protein
MERNQQELQLELARVREQLDVVAVQLAKAWERQLPPDGHSDQQVGRALDVLLEVASAQGAAARIHALRDKLTEKAMTMTMGQLQLADNTKDRKLADGGICMYLTKNF